jgi:hypothetical protein
MQAEGWNDGTPRSMPVCAGGRGGADLAGGMRGREEAESRERNACAVKLRCGLRRVRAVHRELGRAWSSFH